MNLIVVGAIRGRCTSFTVLTATVSEIFGGQTTPSILVVGPIDLLRFTTAVVDNTITHAVRSAHYTKIGDARWISPFSVAVVYFGPAWHCSIDSVY